MEFDCGIVFSQAKDGEGAPSIGGLRHARQKLQSRQIRRTWFDDCQPAKDAGAVPINASLESVRYNPLSFFTFVYPLEHKGYRAFTMRFIRFHFSIFLGIVRQTCAKTEGQGNTPPALLQAKTIPSMPARSPPAAAPPPAVPPPWRLLFL